MKNWGPPHTARPPRGGLRRKSPESTGFTPRVLVECCDELFNLGCERCWHVVFDLVDQEQSVVGDSEDTYEILDREDNLFLDVPGDCNPGEHHRESGPNGQLRRQRTSVTSLRLGLPREKGVATEFRGRGVS